MKRFCRKVLERWYIPYMRFFAWLRSLFRSKPSLPPQVRELLLKSLETIDKLAEERTVYKAMALRNAEENRQDLQRYESEWVEAQAMGGSGAWQPVTESAREAQGVVIKERLAELELALEDRGWKRMLAWADTEFSRWGIQQIMLICRLYKIKNPIMRRVIKLSSYYVFGRGIEVMCEDDTANQVIQDTLRANEKELGILGLSEKHESLKTDGNLFFALFTDVETGGLEVRMIDPCEIQEIVTDEDDASRPLFFHRTWSADVFDFATGVRQYQRRDCWYRAFGSYDDFKPDDGLKEINGKPIVKDKSGDWVWVLHVRAGAEPKWHFGCPPVYAIVDWMRAITHFLEDWASIQRALARFAWNIETEGGAPAIAGLKTALATTLASDGQQIETNPPPVSGSAFITGPGNKLTPVKTAGAQTGPEECRRLCLMVCAGSGMPETMVYGDASTGSLATATSLDRPTELMFLHEQEMWRQILQKIYGYAIFRSGAAPKGKLRESAKKKAAAKATGDQMEDQEITIDVKFPAVLEHDIPQRIGAIVDSMTLGSAQGTVVGVDERTGVGLLLAELGVEDVNAVLEEMYPEADYEPNRQKQQDEQDAKDQANQQVANKHQLAIAKAQGANAPPGNAPQPNTPQANAPKPNAPKGVSGAKEARLERAVETLRNAVAKMEARRR